MAHLLGVSVELILEEGAVEDDLHDMALAGARHIGVIARRVVAHKLPLARFLLHDGCGLILLIEHIQTPLYAEHIAEERRLKHHVAARIVADDLRQVMAYQLINVPLLYRRAVHEGREALAHLAAGYHVQHIVLDILPDTLLHRHRPSVHHIVEHPPRQVSQMDGERVGLRFDFVDEVNLLRFGIGGEATGDTGDIDQIVGFEDDELGTPIVGAVVLAETHQIELRTLPQHIGQITPVGQTVARKHFVVAAVANLQRGIVFLLGGPDEVAVPTLHDGTHHIFVKPSPVRLSVGHGEMPLQRCRQRLFSHDVIDQQCRGLEMMGEGCRKIRTVQHTRPVILGKQFLACPMYERSHPMRNLMGLDAIVQLGERARKGNPAVGSALIDNATEHVPQEILPDGPVQRTVTGLLQLAVEILANIHRWPLFVFHFSYKGTQSFPQYHKYGMQNAPYRVFRVSEFRRTFASSTYKCIIRERKTNRLPIKNNTL